MRTVKRRSTFECGHKGSGKFCHRCKQADLLISKSKKLRSDRKLDLLFEACRLKSTQEMGDKDLVKRLEGLGLSTDEAWKALGRGYQAARVAPPVEEAPQEG